MDDVNAKGPCISASPCIGQKSSGLRIFIIGWTPSSDDVVSGLALERADRLERESGGVEELEF